MSARKVQLNKQGYPALRYTPRKVKALFRWLDQQPEFEPPPGEFSLAFLSEEALAQIHAQFLDDPSPTDVITFEGDPDDDFAGEICVSVPRARHEARSRQLPFPQELTLYLIHGWLHLCGYDDLAPPNRPAMRAAESLLITRAQAQNQIPDFTLPA